jgi:hypothetical protein
VKLLFVGLLSSSMMLHAPAAMAVLGGDAATIHDDQRRMKAARKTTAAGGVQIHEISSPDGSTVKEFVAANGIVFAVVWHTRLKPDLEQLLGRHHADYAAAASEAMKRPGIQRNVVLRRGDVVVQSSGHLNAFVGKAYVPSLIPAGFSIDDIR